MMHRQVSVLCINSCVEEQGKQQELGEEEEVGYMPPRKLLFNHKGEMELFSLKSVTVRKKRLRQLPFAISAGLFTYLIAVNLNTFSFATAGFGTYAKLLAYWLFGWTPSVYLISFLGRVTRKYIFSSCCQQLAFNLIAKLNCIERVVVEMRLLENGSEIKFTTYGGKQYHKKVTDLHPMMDEKILMASNNPKVKNLFYHFHSDGEQFMIDSLPKTNPNIDIIQTVIHCIQIITDNRE